MTALTIIKLSLFQSKYVSGLLRSLNLQNKRSVYDANAYDASEAFQKPREAKRRAASQTPSHRASRGFSNAQSPRVARLLKRSLAARRAASQTLSHRASRGFSNGESPRVARLLKRSLAARRAAS